MRRLILTMLLATGVAMPALAQEREGRDSNDRSEVREARDEARAERRRERREERSLAVPQQRVEAPRQPFEQQAGERRRWGERQGNNDGMTAALERRQAAERAREQWQRSEAQHDGRRVARSRDGSLLGQALENKAEREGAIVIRRDRDDRTHRRGDRHRWDNHWRGDRHYDWRRYRDHNRSLFRRGRYWDPYGSSYRRFSIGFSLFPSYYRSDYWLHDPWMYRLPPAYGPYRWVRYYDDALLVNIYTGRVVDVVHDFFW